MTTSAVCFSSVDRVVWDLQRCLPVLAWRGGGGGGGGVSTIITSAVPFSSVDRVVWGLQRRLPVLA